MAPSELHPERTADLEGTAPPNPPTTVQEGVSDPTVIEGVETKVPTPMHVTSEGIQTLQMKRIGLVVLIVGFVLSSQGWLGNVGETLIVVGAGMAGLSVTGYNIAAGLRKSGKAGALLAALAFPASFVGVAGKTCGFLAASVAVASLTSCAGPAHPLASAEVSPLVASVIAWHDAYIDADVSLQADERDLFHLSTETMKETLELAKTHDKLNADDYAKLWLIVCERVDRYVTGDSSLTQEEKSIRYQTTELLRQKIASAMVQDMVAPDPPN